MAGEACIAKTHGVVDSASGQPQGGAPTGDGLRRTRVHSYAPLQDDGLGLGRHGGLPLQETREGGLARRASTEGAGASRCALQRVTRASRQIGLPLRMGVCKRRTAVRPYMMTRIIRHVPRSPGRREMVGTVRKGRRGGRAAPRRGGGDGGGRRRQGRRL
jgi:hypothetical protein